MLVHPECCLKKRPNLHLDGGLVAGGTSKMSAGGVITEHVRGHLHHISCCTCAIGVLAGSDIG